MTGSHDPFSLTITAAMSRLGATSLRAHGAGGVTCARYFAEPAGQRRSGSGTSETCEVGQLWSAVGVTPDIRPLTAQDRV
jgi:hypothetical protein